MTVCTCSWGRRRESRGVEKLRGGRAVEAYDASAIGPETLVSACNSFSLFGEGPFVVLKDLDAWNAARRRSLSTTSRTLRPDLT